MSITTTSGRSSSVSRTPPGAAWNSPHSSATRSRSPAGPKPVPGVAPWPRARSVTAIATSSPRRKSIDTRQEGTAAWRTTLLRDSWTIRMAGGPVSGSSSPHHRTVGGARITFAAWSVASVVIAAIVVHRRDV
ncbi:hypothetical protein [Kitasatospora paranensis]|uniref:hypothetical protein n=1 Tax=Kitasatospora paranensis TaxID=258053 RepID=UPI0031E7BE45